MPIHTSSVMFNTDPAYMDAPMLKYWVGVHTY